MGTREFLIDTNAVIDFPAGRLPESSMKFIERLTETKAVLSVITKIELLVFFNLGNEDEAVINAYISGVVIIGVPELVVSQTFLLKRRYKIKLPDAVIAATARCYNLKRVTQSTSDFKRIAGLSLVDVHQL